MQEVIFDTRIEKKSQRREVILLDSMTRADCWELFGIHQERVSKNLVKLLRWATQKNDPTLLN